MDLGVETCWRSSKFCTPLETKKARVKAAQNIKSLYLLKSSSILMDNKTSAVIGLLSLLESP